MQVLESQTPNPLPGGGLAVGVGVVMGVVMGVVVVAAALVGVVAIIVVVVVIIVIYVVGVAAVVCVVPLAASFCRAEKSVPGQIHVLQPLYKTSLCSKIQPRKTRSPGPGKVSPPTVI